MFIASVTLGPALGLVLGYVLSTNLRWTGWAIGLAAAAVLLLLALVPVGMLAVRLGLCAGVAVGVLLALTPIPAVRTGDGIERGVVSKTEVGSL